MSWEDLVQYAMDNGSENFKQDCRNKTLDRENLIMEQVFWHIALPHHIESAFIARAIASDLTCRSARRKPLSRDKISTIISRLYFFELTIPFVIKNFARLPSSYKVFNPAFYMLFMKASFAYLTSVVHVTLTERLGEGSDWEECYGLSLRLAIDAGRYLAHTMNETMILGGGGGSYLAFTILQDYIPTLVDILIAAPVQEHPNGSDPQFQSHFPPFTLERKIEELGWIKDGLEDYKTSWDHAWIVQSISIIEVAVLNLKSDRESQLPPVNVSINLNDILAGIGLPPWNANLAEFS
ncbi:hypothetical protein BT69DRAFT_454132 [Atractiella rhizophila]|nr:hypothetical protein BT69DRAFT_454132 [Atractiella rhizophila]